MHLFHVPDLECGGCLGFVVRALQDVDHAIRIEANVPGRTIKVFSHRFESAFPQALRGAGDPADPPASRIELVRPTGRLTLP